MKISQILKETEIKQITGDLIRFDTWTGDLIGKCALGVLACESPDEAMHLNPNRKAVGYTDILHSYGIDILEGYPYLNTNGHSEVDFDFDGVMSLESIIIRLNDIHKFTFKQIADFLEITFDL